MANKDVTASESTPTNTDDPNRREFLDRVRKTAIYAAPAVIILAANKQAIAQSGEE